MGIFEVFALYKQVKGLLKTAEMLARIASVPPGSKLLLLKDLIPKKDVPGGKGRINVYYDADPTPSP